MLKELYCPECGGTNLVSHAYCKWDVVEQKFVLHCVCDEYDYCLDCHVHSDCMKRVFGEWREVTFPITKQEEA